VLIHLLACLTAPAPVGGETCSANPSSAWTDGEAFSDRTDDWGLTDVHGGRMEAVDLDGDGYPDLMVSEVFSNARDDLSADPPVRYHFVLMNRDDGAGGRTFVDETESSGLIQNRDGGVGTSATLFIWGDVDNDGDLDAFAGRYYDAGAADATGDCSEVLLNDGTGHFTFADRSDPCIIEGYPVTAGSFTDFDADGVLDLWQVAFYEEYGYYQSAQDMLFTGGGDGSFTDVTDAAGLELKRGRDTSDFLERDVRRPAYGATACDVNGDDLPDLIASNYGRSWNQLWINQGDGTFVETGEEAHFDADTNLDYTDNYMYACWYESEGTAADPEPSVSCGGSFTSDYWTAGYDDQPARLAGNTFTTACGDIDNDGDNDLYSAEIVHDWAGNSADPTQLLLNDGTGVFERIDNATNGLERRRARSGWNEGDLFSAFMDFDDDGWRDLVLISSDYDDTHTWLWRQVEPGQFEEITEEAGLEHPWPAGVAIADFDLDGDLDFVTGSSTARSGTPWTVREVHFYENKLEAGNWVRLTGLPIGTRVELTAGGVTQMQEVSGGYGHFGIQNDTALHFGLGDVCMIDELDVTRPGAATETWKDRAGNRVLDLR
jgi:hypothetical protein